MPRNKTFREKKKQENFFNVFFFYLQAAEGVGVSVRWVSYYLAQLLFRNRTYCFALINTILRSSGANYTNILSGEKLTTILNLISKVRKIRTKSLIN